MSLSSELSDASSFLSSESGDSRSHSTRRPASQRLKLVGMEGGGRIDEERDSLRNESIAVGIGLLLLFCFTYWTSYLARQGFIRAPDPEDLSWEGLSREL